METPTPKNGFQTSEFAVSAATTIAGFAVMLGYLPVEKADAFTQAVTAVIGGMIVIISTVTYIWGRIKLKQPQLVPPELKTVNTPISDTIKNLSATAPKGKVYPK